MGLVTPSGGLLFWMTVIFGVVFFLLARFGFPVITGMVRKRKDYIAACLREADDARRQMEGVEQTCRQMLEEARSEQSEILRRAQEASQQVIEEAKDKARQEAADIIRKTNEDMDVALREAMVELRNVVTTVSIAASEKILREKLSTDEAQMDFVHRIVDEAEKEYKARKSKEN